MVRIQELLYSEQSLFFACFLQNSRKFYALSCACQSLFNSANCYSRNFAFSLPIFTILPQQLPVLSHVHWKVLNASLAHHRFPARLSRRLFSTPCFLSHCAKTFLLSFCPFGAFLWSFTASFASARSAIYNFPTSLGPIWVSIFLYKNPRLTNIARAIGCQSQHSQVPLDVLWFLLADIYRFYHMTQALSCLR